MFSQKHLVIVGINAPNHIGAHFLRAAYKLNLKTCFVDVSRAFDASRLWTRISWRLMDHRPPRLTMFNKYVLETCQHLNPDYLLVTGIPYLFPKTITKIRDLGVRCFDYLTDDPWSPSHRSSRSFKVLAECDHVFSPRRANIGQLEQIGCETSYLPFGFEPSHHFPEDPPLDQADVFSSDVMFYGGADRDRLPLITALVGMGIKVHLYGNYWERHPLTRPHARGLVTGASLRWAISGAKVTLCLVRRSNRDGHVMRTFEVPAMGGCMLSEDTLEHRELLGGDAVFFRNVDEMRFQIDRLMGNDAMRQHIRQELYTRITTNSHTYEDRLKTMLELVDRI